MNTIAIADEIADFVGAVRAHLSDLDPDERREILDGLEADLGELVADQGADALGDPAAYAAELRAAAGIAEPRASRPARRTAERVHQVLDHVRAGWDDVVTGLPGDVAGLLASVRPVWWVLRAWVAVQLVCLATGDNYLTAVPDESLAGALLLLAAVVASIQLGRGRLWPGDRVRAVAGLRAGLVVLNVLAVVALPIVVSGFSRANDASFDDGFAEGRRSASDPTAGAGDQQSGINVGGHWVTNIFPYDASGKPLVGIQLFDQDGRPLSVSGYPDYPGEGDEVAADPATGEEMPRVYYPWTNGATQVFHAFPLPSRFQPGDERSPTAFSEATRPEIGDYPFATVPRISLPGILGTVMQPPARR